MKWGWPYDEKYINKMQQLNIQSTNDGTLSRVPRDCWSHKIMFLCNILMNNWN
jgi:hypothetical protein